MARTLTAGQELERVKDGVSGVWMVDATWDQYGEATLIKRYASRDYTIGIAGGGSNAYSGIIARGGLSFGMLRIKPEGGLSPVYTWNLRLRDESGESDITDTHVISNDPVVAYFVFGEPSSAEVNTDRIELMRGVAETNKTRRGEWDVKVKDDSKKDLKQIPTDTVNPVTYPYAYQLGAVIPECFGLLKSAPDDHTTDRTLLAPVRFTDRFAVKATASLKKKTGGAAYQWYNQSRRFAKIVTTSESADILTMTDPVRIMYMRPSRPKSSNDRADWFKVAERDASTTVTLESGNNLDVYLSGSPVLGNMTAISVEIEAAGSYTLTVKDDTTTISTGAQSDDTSIALNATTYTAWDLDLLNVEIDGPSSGSTTIEEVYLKVTFDDNMAFSESEPSVFQMVDGFEDVAANYADSTAQVGGSTAIRNPVYQLQALLRAKNLNNLEIAKIDTASFTTAAASRSAWYFDFFLRDQVSDSFLDRFCFQAGLSLWNSDGKWKVVALDKTRDVDHFFAGNYHMPALGPVDNPQRQQYDWQASPPNASKIFNEIAIRYAIHPATGESQKAEIASGQYRLTGTCATAESGNTLIDGSATFVANNVLVGERIYVSGDTDYRVTDVTNETTLVIVAVDGSATTTQTSKAYYLGPNIDQDAFTSQQAYKVVNALGGNRQKTFLDDGGYISELITDDSTAVLLKNHALEWFSQPRDRVKFALTHDGIAVEPGDVLYMDSDKLKPSQGAVQKTTTTEAIETTGETVIDVSSGTAGLFRDDDYVYMQEETSSPPECMKITSRDTTNHRITVSRAQLGTTAQTFTTGQPVYHLKTKWIVTGVQPFSPSRPIIKVSVEEMPPSYFPVGICSDETDTYSDVTPAEQMASGWASLRDGRIVELDPDSATSYCG